MSSSAPITEKQFVVPLVLVTSLFFLWAIGVNLNDILIQHLKKAFGLSDFRSSLIQTAFFGGYFLAALPAGWLMQRLGYKKGILIGLLTCATGAFFLSLLHRLAHTAFSSSHSLRWRAGSRSLKSLRTLTSRSSVRQRVRSGD
jgi:fucose permease